MSCMHRHECLHVHCMPLYTGNKVTFTDHVAAKDGYAWPVAPFIFLIIQPWNSIHCILLPSHAFSCHACGVAAIAEMQNLVLHPLSAT